MANGDDDEWEIEGNEIDLSPRIYIYSVAV